MSIFDKYSRVWNDGKRGFGKESYNDAKAAGISDRELSEGLAGLRIGKIAQDNIDRGMNTSDVFSRYATIWDDNQLGLGRAGYEAARAAGISDQDLLTGIGGNRIGKVALQRINEGMTSAAATKARENERNLMAEKFGNQMATLQSQMASQEQQYRTQLEQMRNTMLAAQNPERRQNVLGVAGAGAGNQGESLKLGRRGMKGTFARSGLRIKNINV
tara:strand:- start:518 stop:1165 length:648 start_codon:yes stop_codon:yes gene_type:complete